MRCHICNEKGAFLSTDPYFTEMPELLDEDEENEEEWWCEDCYTERGYDI